MLFLLTSYEEEEEEPNTYNRRHGADSIFFCSNLCSGGF